jgi:hypothetical protein
VLYGMRKSVKIIHLTDRRDLFIISNFSVGWKGGTNECV